MDIDLKSSGFILPTRLIVLALVFLLTVAFEGLFGRFRDASMVEEDQILAGRSKLDPAARSLNEYRPPPHWRPMPPLRGLFLSLGNIGLAFDPADARRRVATAIRVSWLV